MNNSLEPPKPHLELTTGHEVTYRVIPTNKINSFLPGRFPIQSLMVNNYIFILYNYDSNAILAHPIKSRKSEDLIIGYES